MHPRPLFNGSSYTNVIMLNATKNSSLQLNADSAKNKLRMIYGRGGLRHDIFSLNLGVHWVTQRCAEW